MPHKLKKFNSFDTPYGESYSVDTQLWYNDDEKFPIPCHKPEIISDFAIAGLIGVGEWYDDNGSYGNDFSEFEEIVQNYFNDNNKDSCGFGIMILWNNQKLMCAWEYRYNKRSLEKFISNVYKDIPSKFYTDVYSCYKFFNFPIDKQRIRLVIQDYYETSETFLQNVFDGIIDKKYFILTMTSVLQNAEKYLLDYVYEYAKNNIIKSDILENAIAIAKDIK